MVCTTAFTVIGAAWTRPVASLPHAVGGVDIVISAPRGSVAVP
jgi:hypothetical protein